MTMRLKFAHYCFLALATIGLAGCDAIARRRRANGACSLAARTQASSKLASISALYDQEGSIMFLDGTGELGKTSYLADDIAVPAGTVWKVTQVGVVGRLVHGSLTFSVRVDADGQPGAIVPNTNFWLAPSNSGSVLPGSST